MTYNEWRDELKSNLLCVSDGERRRVLDYYAEAYADRREAGFSEREIIEDFGAPYDAAQRILSENKNNDFYEGLADETEKNRKDIRRGEMERRREANYAPPPPPPPKSAPNYANNSQAFAGNAPNYANYSQSFANNPPPYAGNAPAAARADNTWVFVLLCVLFAVPLFGLITAMAGITIGFCVAPVAVIAGGAAIIGGSIGIMIGGSVAYGLVAMGVGVIVFGVGIILCPLFFKLVSLLWKLFHTFFSWLKSLFSGKERA